MERIKQAVEMAKANRERLGDISPPEVVARRVAPPRKSQPAGSSRARVVQLDAKYLKSMRIVTHDITDPRSRGFEMLRTQLLRKMSERRLQTIGITSPTAGCGKTVCALNLAFSIAHLPERSVTLVDLDLRKPQIASYLGLTGGQGMDDALSGTARLDDISIVPEIGSWRIRVLPTYQPSRNAAQYISSTRMSELVQQLRADDPEGIILFDLPPVLTVDDVISFLPNLDSILLIVASGQTTVSDITNSERLLGSADLMGTILNKSNETIEDGYRY
jgi:protein-tyrosine kinase